MAERIQLSEGEAKAAISNLKSKKDQVIQCVENLQKEVNKVEGWWKGDSAVKFVQEFAIVKKTINDGVTECIEKYCNLLDSVIKAHQQADRDIAAQISRG